MIAISKHRAVLRRSLLILLLFVMCPQYICASEPANASLPPELMELQSQGRLTVRGLWAWKLVPESTTGLALVFRALGRDLLAANQEQLMEWLKQADGGQLQLTKEQRDLLTALIDTMRFGSDAVRSGTMPVEPANARASAVTTGGEDGKTPVAEDGVAMYRDGVARTGVSLSPGPANKPVLLWKLKIGQGSCTPPVISGGSAYFGSQDGYLYAVDVHTGEMHWKFWAEDWIDNTPAVSDGVVYFGNVMGDKSGDRHLFALDARTGKEKWKFKSLFYGVNSSPAVLGGLVYFGAGDNHLYALDALTGAEKWKFPVRESAGTPAIADGLVFFRSSNYFYALDLDTGEQKWSFMAGATIKASPAASGGNVYFGSDDFNLYALDMVSGQEKWKYSAGLITYPPAVHNGTVFLASFDNMFALDANTGGEKWKINIKHLDIKAPVISGDTLYIGAKNFLIALDIQTGQEKWRFQADDEISSPVISKGVAYFWSWDGYLYAVR